MDADDLHTSEPGDADPFGAENDVGASFVGGECQCHLPNRQALVLGVISPTAWFLTLSLGLALVLLLIRR